MAIRQQDRINGLLDTIYIFNPISSERVVVKIVGDKKADFRYIED